ncbi:MAG: radical SAM protein [Treponema sp.]|nr:MAG: radical SAM protein [Treponema sp.]
MKNCEEPICENNPVLPKLVSSEYLKLIENADPVSAEALKKQVLPSPQENNVQDFETIDPLGEKYYQVSNQCIHQYPNRVLILTTGKCFSYCRYCFRREFAARQEGFISNNEFSKIMDYIRLNPNIKEVLLSGGDPVTGGIERIKYCLENLRSVSKNLIIRLCTRSIIFAPQAFTPEFITLLKKSKPLWIIPHINHFAELQAPQIKAIENCIDAGIPMQSQTVLLKGVNDDAEVLIKLFHKLTCLGVKPGYLFQLDTARGTSHFAVPLKQAVSLWKTLKNRLSGLSLPTFAVDLQDGGGKFRLDAVALHENISNITETGFTVVKDDGKVYTYKK